MTDAGDRWVTCETDDEDRIKSAPYQPFLEAAGCMWPLPVWFDSIEACDAFIADIPAGRTER